MYKICEWERFYAYCWMYMWYNHIVTARKHSSCRVFFSLAPIYVYQHLFYWIEKFVQSFNMWIKKTYVWNWLLSSGCVISVRRTYGRIRKTNVYIYSKKCWICHSMNSFKVLVLERCQQTVRYACYIHTDMCAWEVWVSSENP